MPINHDSTRKKNTEMTCSWLKYIFPDILRFPWFFNIILLKLYSISLSRLKLGHNHLLAQVFYLLIQTHLLANYYDEI